MVLAPVVRGRKGEYGKLLRGAARRGLHAREGRRRAAPARRGDRRSTRSTSTTSRSWSTGSSCGRTCASGSPTRSRPRSRWPTGSSRSRCVDGGRGAAPTPSASPACSCGTSMPELEPRIFSFNSPHGACPRCTGLGSQMEIDPELVVPDPSLSLGEGAILPWSTRRDELLRADHPGDRRDATRSTSTRRGRSCPRRQQDLLPLRHRTATAIYVSYRNRMRAQALVHDELRGHRPQPRAPLPRDRLRLLAREDRGVHVGAAVPGVRGARLRPESAGGDGRRHGDPRVHALSAGRGARVARGARAVRPPSARSRG